MAREKISLPSNEVVVPNATTDLITSRVMTSRDVQAILPHYRVTISQEPIVEENRPLVQVVAHLPEEFAVDTQSEYDTPFADGLVQDRRVQTMLQLAGWSPTVQAMTAHFWRGSSPIELNIPMTFFARDGNSNIAAELLKLKSMQLPRVDPATKFLRPPGPRMNLNPEAAKKLFNATVDAGSAVAGMMTNNAVGNINQQQPAGTVIDANDSALDKSMRIGKTFGTEFAHAAQELITVTGKISIRLGKFLYFKDVVIRGVSDAYNVVLGPDQRPQMLTVTVSAVTRMTPTYEDLIGADGIYQTNDPLLAFELPGLNTSRDLIASAGGTDWSQKARDALANAAKTAQGAVTRVVDGVNDIFT